MRILIFITSKFLFSRKNKNNVAKLSLFSLIMVSIGVAVPLIVISITNGFQNSLKEKIENYNFNIIGFAKDLTYKEDSCKEKINTCVAFYEDKVILKSPLEISRISNLRAFSIEDYQNTQIFKTYKILAGSSIPSEGGIVLAESLAINLGVGIGDTIQVLSLDTSLGFKNFSINKLRIDGIVSLGYAELDLLSSFILNTEMPKLFYSEKNLVNRIGINIKNPSEEVIKKLMPNLKKEYPNYELRSMYEDKIFQDFKEEKSMLTISMLIILLISFIVIFITINVFIVDKKFDIAILKVIGIKEKSIIKIFLIQSITIITIGYIIGFTAGSFITKNIQIIIKVFETLINNIILYLNILGISPFPSYYKYSLMPEDKFYLTSLPYKFFITDFIIIGITAISVGILASLMIYKKIMSFAPASLLRNE